MKCKREKLYHIPQVTPITCLLPPSSGTCFLPFSPRLHHMYSVSIIQPCFWHCIAFLSVSFTMSYPGILYLLKTFISLLGLCNLRIWYEYFITFRSYCKWISNFLQWYLNKGLLLASCLIAFVGWLTLKYFTRILSSVLLFSSSSSSSSSFLSLFLLSFLSLSHLIPNYMISSSWRYTCLKAVFLLWNTSHRRTGPFTWLFCLNAQTLAVAVWMNELHPGVLQRKGNLTGHDSVIQVTGEKEQNGVCKRWALIIAGLGW